MNKQIQNFSQLDLSQYLIAPRIQRLVELYQNNAPVDTGICLTPASFRSYLRNQGNDQKLRKIITNIHTQDPDSVASAVRSMRYLFTSELSDQHQQLLQAWYQAYLQKTDTAGVRVVLGWPQRFQNWDQYLPRVEVAIVDSEADLYQVVTKAWLSVAQDVFVSRIAQIHHHGLDWAPTLALIPDKEPEVSLNLLSTHPTRPDSVTAYIEAVWGYWHPKQLDVEPETYLVDKKSGQTIKHNRVVQIEYLKRTQSGIETKNLPKRAQTQSKLTPYMCRQIASHARELENHFAQPLKLQLSYHQGKLRIWDVLAMPQVAVQSNDSVKPPEYQHYKFHQPLALGQSAVSGLVQGRIKRLNTVADYQQLNKHQIVVVNKLKLKHAHHLAKAGGLISSTRNQAGSIAIVARELKLPTVIDVRSSHRLKNNAQVTLDASRGLIFSGKVSLPKTISQYPHSKLNQIRIGIDLNSVDQSNWASLLPFTGSVVIKPTNWLTQNHQLTRNQFLDKTFETAWQIHQAQAENPVLVELPVSVYLDSNLLSHHLSLVDQLARHSQLAIGLALPLFTSSSDWLELTSKIRNKFNHPIHALIQRPAQIFIFESVMEAKPDGLIIDINSLAKNFAQEQNQVVDVSQILDQADTYGLRKALTILANTSQRKHLRLSLRLKQVQLNQESLEYLRQLSPHQLILTPQMYHYLSCI